MGKHDIKTILVTGGAGFIGSHTSVELLQQGIDVIVVDDLSNAHEKVIARIKKILSLYENEAHQVKPGEIFFYKADVKDEAALRSIFSRHTIDAVIHFAGFKAVGESMEK
ncbi:MAG: SDR family NAD(P)-dependent oxidoreductase, partial [Eggerthellaceae bacterium]|nr:SDR family NAD(P)-dependent oxidoreductase [Eggerthellaceae bacterium]